MRNEPATRSVFFPSVLVLVRLNCRDGVVPSCVVLFRPCITMILETSPCIPCGTQYYEDRGVSAVFEWGEYTLTKSEIISFAGTFDPQPYHVGEEAAKDSFFGRLVTSGIHTLSLTVRMTVTHFLRDLASMGGRWMDELRYYQPVEPSDTLEIVEKWPSEHHPKRGYVDLERRVVDENGDEVLSVITHNIVRRPNPESLSEGMFST